MIRGGSYVLLRCHLAMLVRILLPMLSGASRRGGWGGLHALINIEIALSIETEI